MNKFRDKMQNFMRGRYGVDQLGRFTMYASVAALLISVFSGNQWFYLIALVLLAATYVRMFSEITGIVMQRTRNIWNGSIDFWDFSALEHGV